MDNIIFLDIDGNLSSEKYFMANPDRKGDALFIEPEKVKILNELKDIPGITKRDINKIHKILQQWK